MSESTLSDSLPVSGSSQGDTATVFVRPIVEALASLKLTVFLLILAVFVTWVITLEQATLDIWALKNKHFSNLFVYVPLTTFFPLNWFPNRPSLPGGLFLPSGLTIITAMLVNLTTAHVLRFRIQATGIRLAVGCVVLLASALLTWAIIFNYQDAEGFGGKPPIPWEHMWKYLQVTVLGLGIASFYATFTLEKNRNVERIIFGLTGLTLIALLIGSLALGEKAFIGDSAMRILWQLAQSTVAAMAFLVGCVMLFKRKGGIVLLHLGIAGLLVNEIYVTTTNEEHRVYFVEGETVNHADDLRATEFVVIDRSDSEFDNITVLPSDLLTDQEIVDDERLPFKIRCLDFMKNSGIIETKPGMENKADSGIGRFYVAFPTKPASGADASMQVDSASAYVQLIDRETDEPLGTFLVSQIVYPQEIADTVNVGGKEYQIGLRFKTIYTPFSLKLKDTDAKYYVGTRIPSWFSSDFVIEDPENGITSDQKIWMNNPLRYRDLTFYQTTYVEDDDEFTPGKQEASGLQVVRNRGWMIPYVCCMFVVVGLVAQFQQSLIGYLSKRKPSEDKDSLPNGPTRQSTWRAWGPTIAIVGVFGLYYGSQYYKSLSPVVTKSKGSELRLDLLGQVPVTFEGRVQPLDSYARNLARKLSNREAVIDKVDKKQPAIRWLADMMFDGAGAEDYQILRVEDVNVQNALGFPKRKGLKYKLSELQAASDKLDELLASARGKSSEELTVLEDRLLEVDRKSQFLLGTEMAFFGSDGRYSPGDNVARLEAAARLAATTSVMPFSIPTTDPDNPWMPLSVAIEQIWLSDLAKQLNVRTEQQLADAILDAEIAAMKPEYVKKKLIADLLKYEEVLEALSAQYNLKDPEELSNILEDNWDDIPEELYKDRIEFAERFIDIVLAEWRYKPDEVTKVSRQQLTAMFVNRIGLKMDDFDFDPAMIENLKGLKKAYQDGDAQPFNQALETHLATITKLQPKDFNLRRHNAEISYNSFSPFYVASCLYLFAFVVTIFSWLGWQAPINRAAFWLIVLALLVHLGGVVARVVISGRPPITNLYSSFVGVAAGKVMILLVIERLTRIGIGNLLAAAGGFLSLVYAWTLSIDQGDTFTVLRAVLDTQFWLTTHVIIINLGYSATLVAGLVGMAFLLSLACSTTLNQKQRREFTNIIYGSACFALLFSFFGTVLGGLWADDSWGRFWGWDPKENGALMIVLWNAVILHARWAGMVRERGIAALAAFGNIIVIWSWEGVNQLGVGLHAYADSGSGGATGSIWFEPLFLMQMFCLLSFAVAVFGFLSPKGWYLSLANETNAKSS